MVATTTHHHGHDDDDDVRLAERVDYHSSTVPAVRYASSPQQQPQQQQQEEEELPARFAPAVRLLRQALADAPSGAIVHRGRDVLEQVLDHELRPFTTVAAAMATAVEEAAGGGAGGGGGGPVAAAMSLQDCDDVLARIGLVLDEAMLNAIVQKLDTQANFTVEPELLRAVIEAVVE